MHTRTVRGSSSAPSDSASRAELDTLHQMILDQARALKDLEGRTKDATVEIDGEKCPSLAATESYVRINNAAGHSLKFVDAMALLKMVTASSQNFTDNVDARFRGGLVNMERPSDQKAIYSFQLTAPTVLAGTPSQDSANIRTLAQCKTFSDFRGSGVSGSGTVNKIIRLLNDKVPAFLSEIRTSDMSHTAQTLAQTLLLNSKHFITKLLHFTERQMRVYGLQTQLSESRRWELVQAIVRIVFRVISKMRRSCGEITIRESVIPDCAAQILWAILQAHRIQKTFMDMSFTNHPEVAPLLTQFLLDVVAYQDDVAPSIKSIAQATSNAQNAKRKADSVENQVKAPATKVGGANKAKPNKKEKE